MEGNTGANIYTRWLTLLSSCCVPDSVRRHISVDSHLHLRGPLVRHLLPAEVQVYYRPGEDRHHCHLAAGVGCWWACAENKWEEFSFTAGLSTARESDPGGSSYGFSRSSARCPAIKKELPVFIECWYHSWSIYEVVSQSRQSQNLLTRFLWIWCVVDRAS